MSRIYGFVNFGANKKIEVGSLEPQNQLFSDNDIAAAAIGELFEPKSSFLAKTISDLYRQYGEDCVHKLEGQFNFCIWDKRNNKLIIATDRFGTSALHYYRNENCLIFASRIKDILKNNIFIPTINKTALYNYFSFTFIPTPDTIYNEINKLPPGYMLVIENGNVSLKKYWDIFYLKEGKRSEKYYVEKIRQGLEEAVRKRFDLQSEPGTIGAFLSGGLDSSTVSGIMKKISGQQIKTFSIGFEEAGYSELEYVDIAAKHFGLESHQYIVRPKDLLEAIKVLIKEYDEPFGNSSGIAAYYCMKLAKENGVNIMLGGDGGDENFAGYERYVTNKIYSYYQNFPRILRKGLIEPCLLNLPFRKIKNYINHSNIPNPERFFMYELYPMRNRGEIFSDEFLGQIDQLATLKVLKDYYYAPETRAELNRLTYLDAKIGLIDNDLRNKIDKISRLVEVKARYPMLDTRLWELGAKIPENLKLKGHTKKYIYKKAFLDFLPKEIILKKKHGFGVPFALWLKNDKEIRSFTYERLLDSKAQKRGIFQKGFPEKILRLHDEEKTSYYGDIIWVFLMLEIWHNEWADNR